MPLNWSYDKKLELKALGHYVRYSGGPHFRDFQFRKRKVEKKHAKSKDFCFVIGCDEGTTDGFYVLPYWLMRPMLTEDTIDQEYQKKDLLWRVTVDDKGFVTVAGGRRAVEPVDVNLFRGAKLRLDHEIAYDVDEQTGQSIQERRREVEERERMRSEERRVGKECCR